MNKIKMVLAVVVLVLLCVARSRADSFTVTSVTKPFPATTVVLLNTSGEQLIVQGSNDDKAWVDVLYNDVAESGTFDETPAAYAFVYYRLVVIPAPVVAPRPVPSRHVPGKAPGKRGK